MNRKILSHRQRLDSLFSKISSVSNLTDQAEWAKYLCVLVSGFIEESLRILLEEYVSKNSTPNVQKFVGKQISNITNCKTSRILEILGKFNQDWVDDFSNQLETNSSIRGEIKDSIDSVIANRHKIAHGKNVGITYTKISTYYNHIKKAVDILESIVQ